MFSLQTKIIRFPENVYLMLSSLWENFGGKEDYWEIKVYYVQGQQEILGMGHDFPEIRLTAPPPLCCSFMRFLDASLQQTHDGSR